MYFVIYEALFYLEYKNYEFWVCETFSLSVILDQSDFIYWAAYREKTTSRKVTIDKKIFDFIDLDFVVPWRESRVQVTFW